MFFSRLALLAIPAFLAATAQAHDDQVNSCSIGSSQYCCNSAQQASSFSSGDKQILGFFGVNTDNIIGQVGFDCNPLSIAGAVAGGAASFSQAGCNAQSLCCQNTGANGFLAINCTPFIANA